jgi:hypothetical protein
MWRINGQFVVENTTESANFVEITGGIFVAILAGRDNFLPIGGMSQSASE